MKTSDLHQQRQDSLVGIGSTSATSVPSVLCTSTFTANGKPMTVNFELHGVDAASVELSISIKDAAAHQPASTMPTTAEIVNEIKDADPAVLEVLEGPRCERCDFILHNSKRNGVAVCIRCLESKPRVKADPSPETPALTSFAERTQSGMVTVGTAAVAAASLVLGDFVDEAAGIAIYCGGCCVAFVADAVTKRRAA